jgi:hypothetical protein
MTIAGQQVVARSIAGVDVEAESNDLVDREGLDVGFVVSTILIIEREVNYFRLGGRHFPVSVEIWTSTILDVSNVLHQCGSSHKNHLFQFYVFFLVVVTFRYIGDFEHDRRH